MTITEPEFIIHATVAKGDKCVRCWMRDESVGQHPDHPELCGRCTMNVRAGIRRNLWPDVEVTELQRWWAWNGDKSFGITYPGSPYEAQK